MKIDIKLSDASIRNAIRMLENAKDNLEYGLEQTVEILVKNGADIANKYYGSMAYAAEYKDDRFRSSINVTGDAPYIAEFGAGDATIEPMFENYVGVDVYPGAYSEQVGSGEYAATGRWHFGDRVYTEVKPRAGLLNAKYEIINTATEIAKEVIKL